MTGQNTVVNFIKYKALSLNDLSKMRECAFAERLESGLQNLGQ